MLIVAECDSYAWWGLHQTCHELRGMLSEQAGFNKFGYIQIFTNVTKVIIIKMTDRVSPIIKCNTIPRFGTLLSTKTYTYIIHDLDMNKERFKCMKYAHGVDIAWDTSIDVSVCSGDAEYTYETDKDGVRKLLNRHFLTCK
jgi:hypothetical protein